MSAVLLTQVVCDGFSAPTTRPRLMVGTFDVTPLSPTATTDWLDSVVFGGRRGFDEFLTAARDMGRSLVASPTWQNRYILVVESIDDIANLVDARTLR